MKRLLRPGPRRSITQRGISLPEILIATIIFVTVSAVLVNSSGQSLRREELNVIAIDLYGWLETVQREAMSRNNDQEQPCTVTFNNGSLNPGSVLASTAAGCAPGSPQANGQAVFLLPGGNSRNPFTVEVFNGNTVTFSPRGTNTLQAPLTIEFARQGTQITRCLRIDPLLGFLSIGGLNNQTPTANLDCPDNSFDGVI